MNPTRKDVELRRKKYTRCQNSSWLGYSSGTLKPGDFFVYHEPGTGHPVFARCHGQINTLAEPLRKWIFAQVMFPRHTFTGERWVNPEWVTETVPKERVSSHLLALFEELEKAQ